MDINLASNSQQSTVCCFRNGSSISSLISGSLIANHFVSESIVNLNANDTISLVVYGIAGTIIPVNGGIYMNIVRIA